MAIKFLKTPPPGITEYPVKDYLRSAIEQVESQRKVKIDPRFQREIRENLKAALRTKSLNVFVSMADMEETQNIIRATIRRTLEGGGEADYI